MKEFMTERKQMMLEAIKKAVIANDGIYPDAECELTLYGDKHLERIVVVHLNDDGDVTLACDYEEDGMTIQNDDPLAWFDEDEIEKVAKIIGVEVPPKETDSKRKILSLVIPTNGDINRSYFLIVNQWEIDRMAEAEEYLYDLNDPKDFIDIVNMYGVKAAVDAYNASRFCFGGNAFNTPKSVTEDYLKDFIVDEINFDYFKECIENFGNIDYYCDFIEVGEIEKELEMQKIESGDNCDTNIRFYVGLEFFKTPKGRFGVQVTDRDSGYRRYYVKDTKEELFAMLDCDLDGYYDMIDDINKSEE